MGRRIGAIVLVLAAGCDGGGGAGDAGPIDLAPLPDLNPCTASCCDSVEDGDETDVDCGGSCPRGCVPGAHCAAPRDCTSGVCTAARCATPSCQDGVQNGGESDVDCGGSCPVCAAGRRCRRPSDCASGDCRMNLCAAPACNDGIQNGDESDVDCGGSCPRCPLGGACTGNQDCQSGYCDATMQCLPGFCSDGVTDGTETDADCGGPDCLPCFDGSSCVVPGDCRSGVCGATHRCGTCFDGVKEPGEGDVDCGGLCKRCPNGSTCTIDGDCTSTYCVSGFCIDGCSDGKLDGMETDIDCGGPTCPPCALGQDCFETTDCDQSGGPTTCFGKVDNIAFPCPFFPAGGPGSTCVVGCRSPADCQDDCCDPMTMVCGKQWVCHGANNCGAAGQGCFHCAVDGPPHDGCFPDANGADYCAEALCQAVQCAGCCATGLDVTGGPGYFCVHGDLDSACGSGGGECDMCPNGTQCMNHQCVAVPDGGAAVDGGTD